MSEVYLVGGAVRDKLLGLDPKDNDYVIVGATKETIKLMMEQNWSQVGNDFPVFLHPKTGDEYALARVERSTGPGYNDFELTYDDSVTLEEDLGRRDLTINSMAEVIHATKNHRAGAIIDPYNGQLDLKTKVLRHTSDAFAEDPVRVLRLARFQARYPDFFIHKYTYTLCDDMFKEGLLNNLTNERVWEEFNKALKEERTDLFLEVIDNLDALNVVFKARSKYNISDLYTKMKVRTDAYKDLFENYHMEHIVKFCLLVTKVDIEEYEVFDACVPKEYKHMADLVHELYQVYSLGGTIAETCNATQILELIKRLFKTKGKFEVAYLIHKFDCITYMEDEESIMFDREHDQLMLVEMKEALDAIDYKTLVDDIKDRNGDVKIEVREKEISTIERILNKHA